MMYFGFGNRQAVRIGVDVRVVAWGEGTGVRLMDTRLTGRVVGIRRTRVTVRLADGTLRDMNPACLAAATVHGTLAPCHPRCSFTHNHIS